MDAQKTSQRIEHGPSTANTRACPTIEGREEALITHAIAPSMCLQRQREHYHKCHRCVYRGKPASFEFVPPPSVNGTSRNGAARNGHGFASADQAQDA
ncbi:MAG: hypothetical protein KDB80_08020 [Planctomycetes bacterium]|nr:hypothetical protein [Planctomycetota bacterium]